MTDEWDRRTLNTILDRYYRVEVIEVKKYQFDESGIYYIPDVYEYEKFLEYIKSFPMITTPCVFGMHDNADIIKDQQETSLMFSSILATQVSVNHNPIFNPMITPVLLLYRVSLDYSGYQGK